MNLRKSRGDTTSASSTGKLPTSRKKVASSASAWESSNHAGQSITGRSGRSLSVEEKSAALLAFVEAVVKRYKAHPAIISWQLENEALLKGFGRNIQIDRRRLRAEYSLVKRLDPSRPIIMSTSNGWGVPIRSPRPDNVGFSLYTVMHQNGYYTETIQRPWLHQARAWLIEKLLRKPVSIHELQAEPWGPKAIWQMSPEQQAKSMSPERIEQNIAWAKRIGRYPIDFWGAEWWYYQIKKVGNDAVWTKIEKMLE